MQQLIYILYNIFGVPALRLGFFVLSRFNKKAKLGYEGRKEQRNTLKLTLENIPADKKRIIIHCTSVGEYEQAVPVIDSLKAGNPNLFIIVSFFSSSGYRYVKNNPNIDLKIYLPLDVYRQAKNLLERIRPSLFIISKFDVWPNYMVVAGKLNIPTVMIAATLSSNSGRDKGLSKYLNRLAFRNFSMIFPIAEEDLKRFLKLFPYPERMKVTGDTRFDQVYNKKQKVLDQQPVKLFRNPRNITFIAGSIWPADEEHLLPVLTKMLIKHDHLQAVLVPHELHEDHIKAIEKSLSEAGIDSERYTEFEQKGGTDTRVAIVNTIGLLAKLYVDTDFAYVGGSFSSGVHNVMEPAVFGQPVIFGPVYQNSFEAMELMRIESAYSIQNSEELKKLFDILVADSEKRRSCGDKARALIESNIGTTDRIMKILKDKYGDFDTNKNV